VILASQQGHLDVIQVLLAAGAEVNGRAADGGTALIAAARNFRLEEVRALLEEARM
jgi:ankyrin repeat protein